MDSFTAENAIRLDHQKVFSNDIFPLSTLFGPTGGKMFAIMECIRTDSTTLFIKAFSGQLNGRWLIDGWAPPLFDVDRFNSISYRVEKNIKDLGRRLAQTTPHSKQWLHIKKTRRSMSRQLMTKIHGLYKLTNFKGETLPLHEVYGKSGGIPAGTGDCCAPKLLNYAVKNNLTPRGIAEFYWGRENASATRQHTEFYPPCSEKCKPILGFMLCGLEK